MSFGISFLFSYPINRHTMRIIGYIPHPVLKITVFQLNMKLAVKLEAGLMEQTYKFRESDEIRNLSDVERLLDETFTDACLSIFKQMAEEQGKMIKRNL